MKTLGYFVLFLVLALGGYSYYHNPSGCKRVVKDVIQLIGSLLPPSSAPIETKAAPAAVTSNSSSLSSSATPPAPPSSPAIAPTSPSSPSPSPAPLKQWAPPQIIPAQANWTWTTSDGKTYENVTIDKIEPDSVSIMHSRGIAKIPLATLPADLQQKLNYDPELAAAALAEARRQQEHPFYRLKELEEARNVAGKLQLPLAWVFGDPQYTADATFPTDSAPELTSLVLAYLSKQAIVVFLTDNSELGSLPSLVRDQLFVLDDGPMPGGHHFYAPKIVLTDPATTKVYGRVASTQLKKEHGAAILSLLQSAR